MEGGEANDRVGVNGAKSREEEYKQHIRESSLFINPTKLAWVPS